MPCSFARARELLKKKKAAVFRCYPFTILLKNRKEGDVQKTELKLDPGSKTSGVAIVSKTNKGQKAIWAAHLFHRGLSIKKALDSRRAIRRGRRFRHTRYRKARFNNRTRKKGWLAPSLKSRVDNIYYLTKKLTCFAPISSISIETVRFDTQKIQNPEVSGTQYQQGELFGYEIKEYLLEKWGRKCIYCEAVDTRLEVDHIVPRSLGGTNSVSNLVICCRKCNEKKSNHLLKDFLKTKPEKLQFIMSKSKQTLRDTAAINSIRLAIGEVLKPLGLELKFSSGGRTKYNRIKQGYPKDHWIDAVCVGDEGENVDISEISTVLHIRAVGRGSRQMCRVNRFNFPRTSAKKEKKVQGFQTGDIVSALVPKGKKKGSYFGIVSIRSTGNFNIKTTSETIQGINARYCHLIYQKDGYEYNLKKEEACPPRPKDRGLHAIL